MNRYIRFFKKRIRKILLCLLDAFRYAYEAVSSLFDKSVRVAFTNFDPIDRSFFVDRNFNGIRFKFVKFYSPQIHFFSVFGDIKKIKKSKAPVKIFFTGENVNSKPRIQYKGNCIPNVHLSMGFDYDEAGNYMRLPLWLIYFFAPSNSKDDIKRILSNFKKIQNKTRFCSLVSRHDNGGLRVKIHSDVSKIASVDCPGAFLHNDDTLQNIYNDDKLLYLEQFKFNICPENSVSKGYVTEKLFESLFSGCIPIYSGWNRNPEPDIISPDIIMWYDETDKENNEHIMNEIKRMHEDDRLFRSFVAKPYFCDTAVDKIYDMLDQYNCRMQNLLATWTIPKR